MAMISACAQGTSEPILKQQISSWLAHLVRSTACLTLASLSSGSQNENKTRNSRPRARRGILQGPLAYHSGSSEDLADRKGLFVMAVVLEIRHDD